MSVIETVEDVTNERIYTLATLGFIVGGSYLRWFKGKGGFNAPFTIGCVMLGVSLVADWNLKRKVNSRSSAWEVEYEWQNPDHKGLDSLWCFHCGEQESPSEETKERDEEEGIDTCTACGNELTDLESMSYQEYAAEALDWGQIEWYMDTMTTQGKHTASPILETLLRSDDQTKAEALDWLINNYYIHADEQWNAAYILALADALDIQHDFEQTLSGAAESFSAESIEAEEVMCNSCHWGGSDSELKTFTDEYGRHSGCPKCESDNLIGFGNFVGKYAESMSPPTRDWPTFSELVFKYLSGPFDAASDEKEACFYADGFPFCFSVGGRHSGGTISDGLHLGHDPDVWSEPVWGPVGCGSVAADDTDDDALEYLMSGHHPRVSASRADILRWRNWARKTYKEYKDSLRMNAEAMSPSAVVAKKGRVRTASGKPHTPRKLKKDQNITPEEARKRVRFEASQNPPAEAFNPAELVGEQLVRPDGPMTADQAQGFMTNLRRYRKQMAAEDTDAAANVALEDWEDIIMEVSVAGELFDDLAYYFPDEWYNIFLSAYDDPEMEGYQILIIHEDDFDTFIEMRDSLRYLPPSPAREIKEGINLEAFWDEEMEI